MDTKLALAFAIAAFGISGLAAAADAPATAVQPEPPFALDTVEVNSEKRTEIAFRTVQFALERNRSDRMEDADLVVCLKQTPAGTHLPVINCATNRRWGEIHAASLATGLSGLQGSKSPAGDFGSEMMANPTSGNIVGLAGLHSAPAGGTNNGASNPNDRKVFTMSLSDYNKLKKRFGELPPELRDAATAGR